MGRCIARITLRLLELLCSLLPKIPSHLIRPRKTRKRSIIKIGEIQETPLPRLTESTRPRWETRRERGKRTRVRSRISTTKKKNITQTSVKSVGSQTTCVNLGGFYFNDWC